MRRKHKIKWKYINTYDNVKYIVISNSMFTKYKYIKIYK